MQASGVDLALLRFAIQHSDSPHVKDTTVKPEDYEWLREAIKSFETDAQKIKKLVDIVGKNESGVSLDKQHAAYEELQFLVEDLDNASDFVKLGGLPIILQQVQQTTDDQTRVWALWVLSTVVQNHPNTQQAAISLGALDVTISLLSSPSLPVRQKALLATIGLIKDNSQATQTFLSRDGINLLSSLLSHPDSSARMKSAFLLTKLLETDANGVTMKRFLDLAVLAPLVAMADDPNDDAREKAIEVLERVVEDAGVKAKCEELGLKDVAKERVKAIAKETSEGKKTKEESQESIAVLMRLLKKLEAKKG